MKSISVFVAFLLVGLISAAPTPEDEIVVITKEFYPDEFVKYTAEHEIVDLLLPANNLNFEDLDDDDADKYIFFIQADVSEHGIKEYKGLYVLKNFNQATKLLDNGRDFAAPSDESKTVYLAATDGLYTYNVEKNKAEKYGTITDNIISVTKPNGTDYLYILTEDHVVYKVTDEGTKKEKVDKIVGAQQIVADYADNLYYYTSDKQVFVYVKDAVKKIEGLPSSPSYAYILNPAFIMENDVIVVVDNKAYFAYENGTSEFAEFEFVARPSAYCMDAAIIQYYAYDKKIYEYNLVNISVQFLMDELKDVLDENKDTIQELASKKGSGFITSNKVQSVNA